MKQKSSLLLGLICGLSLASSASHASTDIFLNRHADAPKPACSEPAERAERIPSGTLVIYRGLIGSQGIAARITDVARKCGQLTITTEFGSKHVVPYVNAKNAESGFKRIQAGGSIDLSACMEDGKRLPGYPDGFGCRVDEYEQVVNCGAVTPAPITPNAPLNRFELRDIEAQPLLEKRTSYCRRQDPRLN